MLFGYALVSKGLAGSPVTAPMVFTTGGLIVGSAGLGWFDLDLDGEALRVLVEATLVLVLFTDAIRIDLRALRGDSWLPIRLLTVGLPLVVVLGTATGLLLLPGLAIAEAALLAAVLAPTDAALGQAVVSDGRLPVRLRQGINVESGLNDGIALPVVTVFLAWSAADLDPGGVGRWGELVTRQIGFGLLFGLVAGGGGGWVLRRLVSADQVEGVYRQLAAIALAVVAFSSAELLDGNGFIAAFVAGLVFGQVTREVGGGLQDFAADESELLSAITFAVFGAVLVGPILDDLTWRVAAYAALSLTAVRVLPTLVALCRTGTLVESRLFLGWFGPRGLASILFALLVLEGLPNSPASEEIFAVAMWTVLLSVYLHGLTASPWAGRLARRLAREPDSMPETGPSPEHPTRPKR